MRVEIDKIKGINKKAKINKPPKKPKAAFTTVNNRDSQDKSQENKNTTSSFLTPILSNSSTTAGKIYDWIKGGINWLGL
jgi:hypothetical protein